MQFCKRYADKNMNIVIVGHAKQGKSTIIGRMLAETGSLPKGKLEQIQEICRKNFKPFEYALLLDTLKDEINQEITTDSARCYFKTDKRRYSIIDVSGYIEFLKNVVTGASRAEAAFLVIDANEGIKESTKRHGHMISMLGIKQVSIIINKMDLVNYSEKRYIEIVDEFKKFLEEIHIYPVSFIPTSGICGNNMVFNSNNMPWYRGNTVLSQLDKFDNKKISDYEPKAATRIKVNLFWIGKAPMQLNKEYIFKLGTTEVKAYLEETIKIIDASSLDSQQKDKIEVNEVAECILKLNKKVTFDLISNLEETSRFVITDNNEILGGGIIQEALKDKYNFSLRKEANLFYKNGKVDNLDRYRRLNQKGMVIWFTGLSGAGKSTIAIEAEKRLFEDGISVYRLDGDNIRHGLNSDLGFSREDRIENIRRIAEVASLFKDAGFITLVSFITPYEEMRTLAKQINNNDNFYIVYVKVCVSVCEERDPKGLYKKARKGEIKNFTGVSSIYEEPKNADIVIENNRLSIEEATSMLLEKIYEYQLKNKNI